MRRLTRVPEAADASIFEEYLKPARPAAGRAADGYPSSAEAKLFY
jgi:hypothetical protein